MTGSFRAQSAMEYLMTYGWAILIIAVVLAALFALGVFSGASLLGTSCVASSGYTCTNPVMNTAGVISFTFGQNTGSTIYAPRIACAATTNSSGMPYELSTIVFPVIEYGVFAVGTPQSSPSPLTANQVFSETYGANAITTGAYTSGETTPNVGVECYSSNGEPLNVNGAVPLNTPFSGALYLEYNTTPGGTPQYSRFATVTIKVT